MRFAGASFVALVAACSRDSSPVAKTPPARTQVATASSASVQRPVARPDSTATSADTAWIAGLHGVGPITFGMTVEQAAKVAGGTVAHPPGGSCGFVSFRDVPHGARFMVSYDTVVRVDVDSARVPTDAGARVGMTEADVLHRYANRLRVTPHKYVSDGHYLTQMPASPADSAYRIIFETDGSRVTRYRAGLEPHVENVEGCG